MRSYELRLRRGPRARPLSPTFPHAPRYPADPATHGGPETRPTSPWHLIARMTALAVSDPIDDDLKRAYNPKLPGETGDA
ncbi:MAG: hypothetical protein KatS3mg050_4050 [Litorilinea sp.]|nr:MAG: hypothetical protein KatS3mg050_4050 [Litorilinea sp.]